jgi:hypothetical protein
MRMFLEVNNEDLVTRRHIISWRHSVSLDAEFAGS